MAFKVAKDHAQAQVAFIKAAESHRAIKSLYHAGQSLENAATAAKELRQMSAYLDLVKQAAMAYREHGQGAAAAESLVKAGRWGEAEEEMSETVILVNTPAPHTRKQPHS